MQDQVNQRPSLKDIFLVARGKTDEEERLRYLSEILGDDEVMRHRVEQMLLAAESSVPSPLGAIVATIERPPELEFERSEPEIAGTRQIGPYKIREKIGEGGMGVVYVAEQTEPFHRKVALKVIKLGISGPQVVARFETERQSLAMMDHPNIARILDGGATEDELPYFVMELVHGVPITEYCDKKRLTIRQRLEMFVDVCRAVQHAHQKGIIHRDLKPSNIMVAEIDGKAVPKVIDFGVAKSLNQKLTEQSVYTQFSQNSQMLGTPLYMSPEQAGMDVANVDTRSDVYSLGVVLYELLTGETPFDREQLKQVTFDEMRRIIREDEPKRPSTMISTMVAEAQSTVTDHRSVNSQKLRQTLTGELDWLVMKTLEKDRERRYETVIALREDIECFLQDHPIAARPQSATYRLSKFAKRNRGHLVVGSAVASVLLIGLFVAINTKLDQDLARRQQTEAIQSLVGAARAAVEIEDLSTAEQRLAEARRSLANADRRDSDLLRELQRMEEEIKVRRTQYQSYEQFISLAQACSVDEDDTQGLSDALAVYSVLTDDKWFQALQDSYLQSTSLANVHEETFNLLLILAEHVRVKDPGSSLDYLRRASSFHEPTRAFYWVRRDSFKRLGQAENAERDTELMTQSPAVFAMDHFLPAQAAAWGGDKEEAIRGLEAALLVQPDHYRSLFFLAYRLGQMERHGEAACLYRGCIALRPDHSPPVVNLAITLLKMGDRDQAMEVAELAVKRHPDYYNAWDFRGARNLDKGNYDEAFADYSHAIKLKKNDAQLFTNRGIALSKQGKVDKAIADFDRAIELDPKYVAAYSRRSEQHKKKHNYAAALSDCNKVIELKPSNSEGYANRGMCLNEMGKKQEALEDCNLAVELDPDNARGYQCRAIVYTLLRKFAEAEADFSRALELYEGDELESIGRLFFARSFLYGMQELFDEAVRDLEKAIEFIPNEDSLYCGLGTARGLASDYAGAIESFQRAIELNPTEVANYVNEVEFRVFCADIKYRSSPQTLLLAQKAVDLQPKSSESWAVLGLAQCRSGAHTAAIASASKSLELGTDEEVGNYFNVGAYLVLAQSHHRLGASEEAIRRFEQANSRIIKQNLAEDFRARGSVLVFRDEVADELGRRPNGNASPQEAGQ